MSILHAYVLKVSNISAGMKLTLSFIIYNSMYVYVATYV